MANVQRVIRKIHLYAALIIASFLLMYFVTGGVMVMEHFFPRMNFQEQIDTVSLSGQPTEIEILSELKERFSIRGSLRKESTPSGVRYSFVRPGYSAEYTVLTGGNRVQIKIREGSFGAVMNYLHRLRGYSGGWVHWLWSLLYDLSCISLIVFAFSGVFLWWKTERNKIPGVFALLLSTGFTVFMIWYLFLVS